MIKRGLSNFLAQHVKDNVLIVLDTSAWLRLFRAVPNRVSGFLFNYFNCGYPLRITRHIQEEFEKNLEYVKKNAVEVQDTTAMSLDHGKHLQYYAMDKASSKQKGKTYKKLRALYGGKGTNKMVGKAVQAIETQPVIGLMEEETKQGKAEAAELAKKACPFPGSGDSSKTDNTYGDYLIFLELQKLSKEEKADIVFATFDLKESGFWSSFEEGFKEKTGHELCYIDIPSFDQFTDNFGTLSDEVAGRDQRNEVINEHLAEVETLYANEAGKAVEEYFALGRCFLPVPDWRKSPINIRLLGHTETGFKVDFGSSDYGCQASYDCSFNVEVNIEITYQIIPDDRQKSSYKTIEEKTFKGIAQAIITRRYGEAQDISNFEKEHWIDVSNVDLTL